jgi:iron(III) transport system ATP-binding protein
VFLTDTTEYLVPIGDQLLKFQTPHRITFGKGEECYVDFTHVMWYPEEDESAEAERAKRQLV